MNASFGLDQGFDIYWDERPHVFDLLTAAFTLGGQLTTGAPAKTIDITTEGVPFAPKASRTPKAPAAPASALPALHDQEKRLLQEALRQCGNNQSKAARVLRISGDTLRYRINRYGIE